jgi:Xaa-Pro aminopeptidase
MHGKNPCKANKYKVLYICDTVRRSEAYLHQHYWLGYNFTYKEVVMPNSLSSGIGFSHTRKIDPSHQKPDGSPLDNDRIEIGPTQLAFDEWADASLQPPNLASMRAFRLQRLVRELQQRDYAAVLCFDPLNIRYATDSTNMQLWNAHNPFRAVLVCADGHMVLWDYEKSPFLADHNPLVKEVRSGASMFYFAAGDNTQQQAAKFAKQIRDILQQHCGANLRLAVDKIMVDGYQALESVGLSIHNGESVTEHARKIKGADEILAMRCAMHACEQSIEVMRQQVSPGMTENDIWAILHAENIKRGGEWIETRLLSTGPRTNPWFQECGPRVLQNNEILAFDTDLVGVYGMCCDISRTWFVGDGEPSQEMIDDYQLGMEHITHNMELLWPGQPLQNLTHQGHVLPDIYQKQKYSCPFHGVGLCDEWPHIAYPDNYLEGAFNYQIEPGMMFCVEALVSREGGNFSIKLEDQVLITESGYENITNCPHDPKLFR